MLLNSTQLHIPETLAEAQKLIGELDNFKIQAGGTFLVNNLKHFKQAGRKTPENVISLHKLDELRGISIDQDYMQIGAMTTIADLYDYSELTDNFESFRLICKNISTQQIRNMATVGGNLTCRYTWTEMPAVMIGFNATLHFIDSIGNKAETSAEEFFKNNAKTDNLLTHITIPRSSTQTIAYQRVRKTISIDIPMLSLIIITTIKENNFNDTRVVINNCIDFAQRDTQLEDYLNGKKLSEDVAKEALENLTPEVYDNRASDYKSHMARISLKNAILDIVQQNS